jgi:hypothetical protein
MLLMVSFNPYPTQLIPLLQREEGLGEEAAALLKASCLPPLPSPLLPAEERGQEGAAP